MLKMRFALATLITLAACSENSANDGGAGGGSTGGGGAATGGGAAAGGGGGGASDSGVDAGLPLSQYCGQLAQHLCAHEQQCSYLDPAQAPDCLAAATSQCQLQLTVVNDGRYAYDPASVPECFAAIDNWDCRTHRLILFWGIAIPYQCNAVLGTAIATTGHSCASDYDCDAGFCDAPNGACGTCAPFLAMNQPCQQVGCDPRVAWCDPVAGTCQPVMTPGQGPCTDSPRSCGIDGYCANSVNGAPRVCEAKKADGMPCINGSDCRSYFCNENRYGADAGPSVCGFDAVGAGCGFNADCSSGICDHSVCLPPATNQPVGARCGDDRHCQPSLYCGGDTRFGSTCQPRLDAGEPCSFDSSCLPGMVCSQSIFVCVPVGHPGEPCGALDAGRWADNRECTELLWCETDGGTAICVPELPLNAACDEQMAVCAEGQCLADGDAGMVCTSFQSQLGKVCADNSECQSGRCLQDDGGFLDAFHTTGNCADFCQ